MKPIGFSYAPFQKGVDLRCARSASVSEPISSTYNTPGPTKHREGGFGQRMPEAHPLSHLPYGDATPQERLDVLLTTNGKLERVEQLPPTTETLLRSSRSAVSIGYVMPPSMQRSGMMGSLPMLHTPSKPVSTKREITRQLAPGIIGLMRRTDHERTSGTGATVPVAEAWLEDMLDLIHVREPDGSMPSGGERNGLSRAKLDRQSLLSEGLTPEQVARLHQTLFVLSLIHI